MPVAVHLPGYQGPVRLDLSLRPAWGDPVLNVFVIEKQKLLRCEAGSFDSCRYLADETFGCTSSPVYLRVAGVPVKVLNDGPYTMFIGSLPGMKAPFLLEELSIYRRETGCSQK